MRRFTLIAPLVLALVLVNLFGSVPVLQGAQDGTPEAQADRGCTLNLDGGVTIEDVVETPSLFGNSEERLQISRLVFSETEPGTVEVVDCAATEVYRIDEGSLLLELRDVDPAADGRVIQLQDGAPCAGQRQGQDQAQGGCTLQDAIAAQQPLTLTQGDMFTHDGRVSYTIRNEALTRADPTLSRGCVGRC